jgi:hypothetical protein
MVRRQPTTQRRPWRDLAWALTVVAATGCSAGAPAAATAVPGVDGGAGDADAADAAAEVQTEVPLTPADLARRLSLYLWAEDPDQTLIQQVYANPPATRQDVRQLALSMLGDPRARSGVRLFLRQWLGLDGLGAIKRDAVRFPEYTPALLAAMIGEAEAFGVYAIFDGDGRFPTLFTADFSFLNQSLAAIYGVSGVIGADLRKVALDPAQRAGVLTMPAMLIKVVDDSLPPVTARGGMVTALLCRDPPVAAPNLLPTPPPAAGQTTRQWIEKSIGGSVSCIPCHNQADPIGFALENFDAIGRFITTERGLPIDAAGILPPDNTPGGGPPPQPLNGPRELAAQLSARTDSRACFIQQLLRFATGAPSLVPQTIQALLDDNTAHGDDLRSLIAAVAATDEFLRP